MITEIRKTRVDGEVAVPPSKSYTHRAIALALLAEGESHIERPLISRDTEATIQAAKQLGANIKIKKDNPNYLIIIDGRKRLSCPEDVINAENSGTTLRFFTAIAALAETGYTIITGDESLRRRPMGALLNALIKLGVNCWSSKGDGTAPIIVRGGGIRGGETSIIGWQSSQFISAILIAGQRADGIITLRVEGEPVSKPYIDATIAMIERFGGCVERSGYTLYVVGHQRDLKAAEFRVPGDFGSASFHVAAAYLSDGSITLKGLDKNLPQADAAILDIASKMGANVSWLSDGVIVEGRGTRKPVEIKLRDSPDLLPVAAVMAAATPGTSILRDVAHARLKESDRIQTIANELTKLGVKTKILEDGLEITGLEQPEGGVTIDSHNDHRLFMAFTILGLACKRGLRITGAESASVSYPGFINDLAKLGAEIRTF